MRDKKGRFVKGYRSSPKTEFKKGENLGKKHPNWKGGRIKLKNGYIWAYAPNHPKAYRNGVYEHILIAEKKIGRFLEKKEVVHHINGIKDDNRFENIVVCRTNAEHIRNNHKANRWSRKYDKCRLCNTNKRKHRGLGLCANCYGKYKYHECVNNRIIINLC